MEKISEELLQFYMVTDYMWGTYMLVGCNSKITIVPLMTLSIN